MNVWKKTYVITALCAITAGILYLTLPISQRIDPQSDSIKNEVQLENILYRINENSIETSEGIYAIDENTKWIFGETEVSGGKSRFLGQEVQIKHNEGRIAEKIMVDFDLSVPQKIRVVLAADSLGENYLHSKVAITSDEAFWSIKDGTIQTHSPKAEITSETLGKRTIFIPAKEGTALTLISPNGTKTYLGRLEVTAEEHGYSVVNEVAFEDYIKGVVPSEMPGSYGEEAAKVQAVCARSYAYNQWSGTEKFACWGAHVDDSVKSQVYGGNIEHEDAEKGVKATWGEFLTYNGKPISTNYFSTSCGYTANANEVWEGKEESYQKGGAQYVEEDVGDLSTEEGFHEFITNYELKTFDSHSPWFRWSVEISFAQIQQKVSQFLLDSPMVKVVKDDALMDEKVNDIGNVTDLFVYERSQTGMALSILVMGDEKNIIIEKPTEIRKLLGDISVTLMNGELAGTRDLLPSAFISLEKIKDTSGKLISMKIWGGGYGHGVGMSQNGVKGMIEEGYGYREILNHYFPETEITIL